MSLIAKNTARVASAAAFVLLAGCADMYQQNTPVVQYNPPSPSLATMPVADVNWFRVDFATNSAQLDAAARGAVNSAADRLPGNSAVVATVVGKADHVGSDAANMRLSRQRAQAVRDALIQTGRVDAKRVETRWTGERSKDEPVLMETADARARVVDIAVH